MFQLANRSLSGELLNAQRNDPSIMSAMDHLARNGNIESGIFKAQSGMQVVGGRLYGVRES